MFNIVGSFIGSHLALKGKWFCAIIFLVIVSVMILKYGYDVLKDISIKQKGYKICNLLIYKNLRIKLPPP